MPTQDEMSRRARKAYQEIADLAMEIVRRPDYRTPRDNGELAFSRLRIFGRRNRPWRKN